jgi:hypothetical protein
MLSAIVVNQENVATGKMEPKTLKGFIGAARDLGYVITGEEVFSRNSRNWSFAGAAQADALSSVLRLKRAPTKTGVYDDTAREEALCPTGV